VVDGQGLLARHDAAADLEPGQRLGVAARGEHDVAARQATVADDDGVRPVEHAGALDVVDLRRLHQALQALVQAADDAVLVRVDARHVDRLERGLDTEGRALAGDVGHLRRVEQRLRRDAALVEARAAEATLLDECDGQAQLCRPQGAGVAAGPSTENDDVVVACGISRHVHVLLRVSCLLPRSTPHSAVAGPGMGTTVEVWGAGASCH
jgi:hypothetical protein